MAYCVSPGKGGKRFLLAEDADELLPSDLALTRFTASELAAIGAPLPTELLPEWSGIVNPSLYGIVRVVDLLNERQQAATLTLCRLIREEYEELRGLRGDDVAAATAAFLSGLIDQMADWNSRVSMWISQNEQIGRGLSGPGIPMLWDYAEIDPVGNGPANLWKKLDRIVAGMRAIPRFQHVPRAIRGDARKLPFHDDSFDLVVTDPPYFDNLFYNVLADCIYVWKRLALGDIFPDDFGSTITDAHRELSASKHRHDGAESASAFYSRGMTGALTEARRVLKPLGLAVMFYGHSSVQGWASLLQAFRTSSMELVAAWPIQVERRHRPRAMRSRAVNTTFVLVAREEESLKEAVAWDSFRSSLRLHIGANAASGDDDESSNQIAFATAAVAYSRTGGIVTSGGALSDETALDWIAAELERTIASFRISRR